MKKGLNLGLALVLGLTLVIYNCTSEDPAVTEVTSVADSTQVGGRLYDKWYGDASYTGATFSPGTSGGPNSNGTLNNNAGTAIANKVSGDAKTHKTRCKECHGWDYQGSKNSTSIYGKGSRHATGGASGSLLTTTLTEAQIVDAITNGVSGSATMPAFKSVMSTANIAALAAHIVAIKDGTKPKPTDVFEIIDDGTNTGNKYHGLLSGGVAATGKTLVVANCTSCHGATGKEEGLDGGVFSLGGMTRNMPAEGYHKIVNGNPGSTMKAQVTAGTVKAQNQEILDILAELCNAKSWPQLTNAEQQAFGVASGSEEGDISSTDKRCGGTSGTNGYYVAP